MKKILLVFMLFVGFASVAQNLDPTKLFPIDYSVPPRVKDYAAIKNVCIELQNANYLASKSVIESELNPNYYTIVAERTLSEIYFKVSNSMYNSVPKKYSTTSESRTDKNGKPYTVTTHHVEATYRFSIMIEMYTGGGVLIKSKSTTKDFTVKASESDKNYADNKFNQNYSSSENSTVTAGTLEAFRALEADYLYALENTSVTPIRVKSRKFDYTDMNEAADLVTKWLTDKNYSLEDEGIKKALNIYQEALKELNAEEKKVRVNSEIGAVCNYMIAAIHFATKDYAKANELILISEELDKRIHFTQEGLKDVCAKLKEKGAF